MLGVVLGLEADDQSAADIEHWPLDHRWLRQHQRESFFFGEILTIFVRQFAERRAGAIEQDFPSRFFRLAFEHGFVDAFDLVIVKRIFDAVRIEPGARLFHCVARLDAVNRNRLRHAMIMAQLRSRVAA